jgi:fructokinase
MFVVGGESLIDLISKPAAADGTRELVAKAGGSPMNCAIALSKLGNDTGFLCPISTDTFGEFILKPLQAAGVKQLLTERVPEPSTLAVVTDDGRGNPRYAFYREADRAFSRAGLIHALPEDLTLFQVGGFCPIEPQDAVVWLDVAEEASKRGATISIDPNVRPSIIPDMVAYGERLASFLDLAHIVKVSEEDLHFLDAGPTLETHAAAMLKRPNVKLVVITLGTEGSMAFTKGTTVRSPIYPATPGGDNVGAGDTLMAGILTWLADNGVLAPDKLAALGAAQLKAMLWYGAVAAGINCSRVGANSPTRDEVEAVVKAAR